MGFWDCNSSFCFGRCDRCEYVCSTCKKCNKCIEPDWDPSSVPNYSDYDWAYLEMRKKAFRSDYDRTCWCKTENKCTCTS